MNIFISHASQDAQFANEVCTFLESNGMSCWIAPRNILPGREYGAEIIAGIEQAEIFVLIFSPEANQSKHVLREVERAVSKGSKIICYKIKDIKISKSMEYFLATNQWLDATKNKTEKLSEFLKGLQSYVTTDSEEKKELFGEETKVKFRPHHFNFTEPSAEMDVTCFKCGGSGCRFCKGSGWIEILGCGMVHPNVLKMSGIDAEEYSGFAFGIGLERIALLKYEIDDMRLLYENDQIGRASCRDRG